MKLSALATEILGGIDAALRSRNAPPPALAEALVDFATVVGARDGQAVPVSAPELRRESLLRARKLVGIIARNDLASRWARATYDIPADADALDALEARVVVGARRDFNTFAEFVSTRVVPKKEQALLGRVAPIVQAPAHREWARLWDDPANRRMVITSHNEAAKTRQLSTLRPLFELGRDHNLKIAILTNTTANAVSILRAIADLILTNPDVRRVFPTLKPSLPWNTTEIQVERDSSDKEPSVAAFGLHGAILGSRVDLLIVDDILDSENTSSLAQMAELSRWFKANVETRLTEDARVLVVGTPWAVGDLLDELERNPEYRAYRFPIYDDKGNSTWPDVWPKERIEARRRTLREVEFQRSMMVIRRADADSLFKEAHVNRALELGAEFPRLRVLDDVPHGLAPSQKIFAGVDLATGSQRKRRDDSSIAGLLSDDSTGTFTVIALDSGRWTPSATKDRIRAFDSGFHPGQIDVEDNGGQKFFLDELTRDGLPVRGHTTTAQNKHDAAIGLPGLATAFEQGKFVIPAWIAASQAGKALVHALLYFNPNDHTPDVLMAIWIAFAAAKTARRAIRVVPSVGVRIIGAAPESRVSDQDAQKARTWRQRITDVPDLTEDEEADERERARNARHAGADY